VSRTPPSTITLTVATVSSGLKRFRAIFFGRNRRSATLPTHVSFARLRDRFFFCDRRPILRYCSFDGKPRPPRKLTLKKDYHPPDAPPETCLAWTRTTADPPLPQPFSQAALPPLSFTGPRTHPNNQPPASKRKTSPTGRQKPLRTPKKTRHPTRLTKAPETFAGRLQGAHFRPNRNGEAIRRRSKRA